MEDDEFKFIICFDGGGMKGYFSLLVVKKISENGLGLFDRANLIGGTSTGGIIASAKAVSTISDDDLIDFYISREAKDLFSIPKVPDRAVRNQELSSSSGLVKMIENKLKDNYKEMQTDFFVVSLIKDKEYGEKQADDCSNGTKFIKSLKPVLISNYVQSQYNISQFETRGDNYAYDLILNKFKDHESYEITDKEKVVINGEIALDDNKMKVSDAIRCTAGIPVVFKLFEKNNKEFYDGGVKYNNPIGFAYLEARQKYPTQNLIIISIGTGKDINHQDLKDKNKDTNEKLKTLLNEISTRNIPTGGYQVQSTSKETKKLITHIKELHEIRKFVQLSI